MKLQSEERLVRADRRQEFTPYDEFNREAPERFPERGLSARAAEAIVNAECWTDANPMLNLSSFVTTYLEPEAHEVFERNSHKNFADPDMYPT